jgi:UDP-N-acetylmuramoyl-tripeptide--D-alanyl-D-alanine ligase
LKLSDEPILDMSHWTLQQLVAATAGTWQSPVTPEVARPWSGRVVIDSRDVLAGDIFWALPGSTCHGARFIPSAFERGAAGVVTDQPVAGLREGDFAIKVKDSIAALSAAAGEMRRQFTGKVIAVTGSVGKTTTRQLIHQALGSRFAGSASPHNYNNHLGVPLSILAWDNRQDYAVLELGASAAGEIHSLARLAAPQIGVITRIGEAHLAGFGSHEAILSAKAELLECLPAGGAAVLNGDDVQLRRLKPDYPRNLVWVGRGLDNDLVATHIHSSQGRLELLVDGQRFDVPLWGRHHVSTVLSAVAVGRLFDITDAEIARSLAEFEAPPLRCEVSQVRGASLINDTYNSNPTSMRAALEVLRDFDSPGRRIVVCGDMKELGEASARLHREIGDEVVTCCGADVLIACGQYAGEVVAGARAAGMPVHRTFICREAEEAASQASRLLAAGDVVLVKGSRAMKLERCVEQLAKAA